MTTLVIGARGSVGRHVLEQLRAAGEPVRASVRDLATAGDLPRGVPVVAADLSDPATLPAALDGVRQVFAYAVPQMANLARAARGAGVEHVVLMSSGSVLLPWTATNAIAREHRHAEAALAGHGPRTTPIRPLVLAGNALGWRHSIRRDGVVKFAHPDAATAPVHEHDIAAVAVAALTGTTGRVSDLLTGPALVSQRHQAELIAVATGRPIRVEELTEAEALGLFAKFMPREEAAAVLEFIADAAKGGSPATDTARRVLGRDPLPFARWATDHAADFRP